VQQVYKFEDAPKAYSRVADGKTRGKIVIAVTSDAESKARPRPSSSSMTDGNRDEYPEDRNTMNWSSTASNIGGTLGGTVAGELGAKVGQTLGETVGGTVDKAVETVADLAENFPPKFSGPGVEKKDGFDSDPFDEKYNNGRDDKSFGESTADYMKQSSQAGAERVQKAAQDLGVAKSKNKKRVEDDDSKNKSV
jgi:hypothetical protein